MSNDRINELPIVARLQECADCYDAQLSPAECDTVIELIKELVEHIRDHARFAVVRIQDGKDMGAAVWRIALEDMAAESCELLARIARAQ
jgi:hypothetical protein